MLVLLALRSAKNTSIQRKVIHSLYVQKRPKRPIIYNINHIITHPQPFPCPSSFFLFREGSSEAGDQAL
jgi:hypothetical protein